MQILRNTSLLACNTLGLEARSRAMAVVNNEQQLPELLQWAKRSELNVLALGEGSNVVFSSDLEALVLRMQTLGITQTSVAEDAVTLAVKAGENWHQLVRWTLQQGYFGLQNLALIPGTVGAAPIQNIGAYGVELESCISAVHATCIDTGRSLHFSPGECEFSYRDSLFKNALRDKTIITQVDFRLSTQPRVHTEYPALAQSLHGAGIVDPTPHDVFNAVVAVRSEKLPDTKVIPNAGSFFKNPLVDQDTAQQLKKRFSDLPVFAQAGGYTKLAAAWMIQYCGYKGVRRDGVGVHPDHALVMINYDNRSGQKLLALAHEIALEVEATFGVRLEIEPRVY